MLLRPQDLKRSLAFYKDSLSLAIYREFGEGQSRGTVFFLGGGYLELSGTASQAAGPNVALWMQVRDLSATASELSSRGVLITRPPRREAWGLDEMWVTDPDGVRIYIVEVPPEHPLRLRES